MITLKESLLDDIQSTMATGDELIKGVKFELNNIRNTITKLKNWQKVSTFTRGKDLEILLPAQNILSCLGIKNGDELGNLFIRVCSWDENTKETHYKVEVYGCKSNASLLSSIYGDLEKTCIFCHSIITNKSVTKQKFLKSELVPLFDDIDTIKQLHIKYTKHVRNLNKSILGI